jgi:hypothetical protein
MRMSGNDFEAFEETWPQQTLLQRTLVTGSLEDALAGRDPVLEAALRARPLQSQR